MSRAPVVFLLVLAGCSASSRNGTPERDRPESRVSEGPPGRIEDVDPAAAQGKALGSRLKAGDRLVREYILEIDLERVGDRDGLASADPVSYSLYRGQRWRDEILAAPEGRPASVRRTYFRMTEEARLETASGRVQEKKGPEPAEAAVLVLEEGAAGEVRVRGENLPVGVFEADLELYAVTDTVAIAAFAPGRPVSPGEQWTVPIARIVDILGRKPASATYEGRIEARYEHTVSYDGETCARIALQVHLEEAERQQGDTPVSKQTRTVLEGEMYYSLDAGHPRYLRLSGPSTTEYQPQGALEHAELARPFTLQGEMKLEARFERLP